MDTCFYIYIYINISENQKKWIGSRTKRRWIDIPISSHSFNLIMMGRGLWHIHRYFVCSTFVKTFANSGNSILPLEPMSFLKPGNLTYFINLDWCTTGRTPLYHYWTNFNRSLFRLLPGELFSLQALEGKGLKLLLVIRTWVLEWNWISAVRESLKFNQKEKKIIILYLVCQGSSTF